MSSAPFLGGLNTELSGIVDSTDFTKEELNMLIRADGSRSRRPGVDYEENFRFNNEYIDPTVADIAFNCIEWFDINSEDESQTYDQTPYIVVQIGSKIIFFRNHGQPYSSDQTEFSLNLLTYKITGRTDEDVAKARCKFTTAYGCLFITSDAIRPIRLRSAMADPVVPIDITYPYCTVSCSAFRGKHQRGGSGGSYTGYYEFYFGDILIGHFDVDLNGQYYVPFPNSYTMAQSFNSIDAAFRRNITATPFETAPDTWTNPNEGWPSWSPDDYITFNAASSTERGLKITIKVHCYAYKSGRWHPHDNEYSAQMAGGSSSYTNVTDLSLSIRDTSVGAKDYLSVDENPTTLSYAHLYNLLNQGWNATLIGKFYAKSTNDPLTRFFPGNNLAQQYLKDKKTDAFKPEDLVNMTFGNTPAARGHVKMNFFKQERNTLTNLSTQMNAVLTTINNELGTSYTLDDILDLTFPGYVQDPLIPYDPAKQVPVIRSRRDYVADTIAYAGRIFYLSGDTLLYSQMISEDISKAGECYTEADPTSEEISDVIETDGGLISLPDIGDGVKLAQYGQYLFVFGTRGNAVITGTANNIFTATAYSAGTLGSVPTQAPDSFVNTEYGVFYWGTTGIYLLGVGENGLTAQDISSDRILTWYGKLNNTQHKWCKGVYSSSKKKVYWFYPTDENKPRRLDGVLVFDIQKNAFTTHKIATGYTDDEGEYLEADLPEIVSGLSLKVPFKSVKEYPIIASDNTYVEADGDYTKFTGGLNVLKSGILLRCDFSVFSELTVGQSVEIFKLGGGYVTISVVCTNPGEYNVVYTVNGSDTTTGIWLSSEVMWIGLWMASESDGEVQTVSVGYVGEYELLDTGYTAQNLPDAAAGLIDAFIAVAWSNISDTNKGDVEFYTAMIGDADTGFSYALVDPNSDTFIKRWGSLAEGNDESFYEVIDEDDLKLLADNPIDSEEFTYESSILLCYDVQNGKVTFGDFRNNLIKDWTAGDWSGDGYVFDSYLISHPMNSASTSQFTGRRITDITHTKNLPYLITYFRRTETGELTTGDYVYPSECQGSILWDWRTSGRYGKWSSPTDLYRPYRKTLFDQGYVINKTNVRGLGRAYQVKLESVDSSQFILEGLVYDLKNDGRI